MTPSGIEPETFRFVAQCLNHLRHRRSTENLSVSLYFIFRDSGAFEVLRVFGYET
jgi:hypothetical protein